MANGLFFKYQNNDVCVFAEIEDLLLSGLSQDDQSLDLQTKYH